MFRRWSARRCAILVGVRALVSRPCPRPTAQLAFDELGTPLREVTFVVLDLETTGGAHTSDTITEIGAVKVRGGERIGELATLVDPGTGVPPNIVALTGITTAMVSGAPPLAAVLPSLLEFLAGAVLVAHNAPFDAGFLRAACKRHGQAWPRPPVLCTARLARAVLSVDEAPSVRLGALARLFGTATTPNHRALADARATVEVLHRLLERVGNVGVQSLPELLALASDASAHRPTTAQRRKRTLAEAVPSAPGVYLFRGPRDEVLYVGTSGDLRRRVRSYFTAGERRRRVRDMVALAERVDTVVCAHALEAAVRELRLIAAHRPRYNRRSRAPHHAWWVTTTAEAFPRLSVVAHRREGAVGPFRSRQAAVAAVETVLDAVPVRACTQRIAAHGARASPCALHELGRCAAPCAGLQTPAEYAPAVVAVADLFAGRADDALQRLRDDDRRPRRPRAVRDRGPPPRPARRARAGAGSGAAVGRARGRRRAGRRAARRARRLGDRGGAPRPPRRGRGRRARGAADAGDRRAARGRAGGAARGRAAARGARRGGRAAAPLAHHRRHPARARRAAVGRARPQRHGVGGVGAARPAGRGREVAPS